MIITVHCNKLIPLYNKLEMANFLPVYYMDRISATIFAGVPFISFITLLGGGSIT